jgi:hypothetical protein
VFTDLRRKELLLRTALRQRVWWPDREISPPPLTIDDQRVLARHAPGDLYALIGNAQAASHKVDARRAKDSDGATRMPIEKFDTTQAVLQQHSETINKAVKALRNASGVPRSPRTEADRDDEAAGPEAEGSPESQDDG